LKKKHHHENSKKIPHLNGFFTMNRLFIDFLIRLTDLLTLIL